ncbi:MAG: D-alanyl-D-alanine carboxypeptidase, partial [Magnetococcales bacterium]|nr:D-alanyl-D-alanine carboxypeptidase [Magnetococcales bacterium]
SVPGGEKWRLSPGGARQGWDWVPVKNPGQYTATVFRRFAKDLGMELPIPAPRQAPADAANLVEHHSPFLSTLVDKALEFSNNLWTELIGMTAASRAAGGPLTSAQAGEGLSRWYAQNLPNIDWNGFHLANSSGLASASRSTPAQMVEILKFGERTEVGEKMYLSLLPISGWKGTLHNKLNSPSTALRVWAKTGTINYGKALAGYLFSANGRRLAFAAFVSDIDKRRQFDQARLMHGSGGMTTGWNGRAGGLIYALVENWIRRE